MLLRYTAAGYLFLSPEDDPDMIIDAMLDTGYHKEFCVALDFEPDFIARLMEAGFLVMSTAVEQEAEGDPSFILLPKLHLVRSALFFKNLHVKKSIQRFLGQYELRVNEDFEFILDRCVAVHGSDWLTSPLVDAIKKIRRTADAGTKIVQPVSFGLYRNGKLAAGEFGIVAGRVYTSYSGYFDEDNAGTVQLIKTTRWLEDNGFSFFDLGMPLDYKTDLGAENISPEHFIELFRFAKL
jgi:Leu/Phe-tRNA-protein transferase